jgi:hypothetical protein
MPLQIRSVDLYKNKGMRRQTPITVREDETSNSNNMKFKAPFSPFT